MSPSPPRRGAPNSGEQLFSAVERILESPDALIARVEGLEAELDESNPDLDDGQLIERVADSLISSFANRTAAVGGLSSAPALIPLVGTALTLVGGNLVDMTFCLKYEVELVLCLTYLYGYDIRDDRERARAFLLASVSTYSLLESERGPIKDTVRAVGDLAQAETQAIFNYTPRQIGKMLTKVFAGLAIKGLSKGLLKAMPVIGIGIAAASNRWLTQQVGDKAREALRYRVASES